MLFTVVANIAAQALWADGRSVAFDIPAGDFSQSVIEFYKQSKVEILYASVGSIGEVRTQAVVGTFDVEMALRKMLEGTGFTFDVENDRSFLLKRVNAAAPANNGVLVASPAERVDGAVIGTGNTELVRLAPAELPQLQDVVVTGTFLHGVQDIMSPLVRLDKKTMRATPYATVQDALQTLPSNSGGFGDDVPGSSGNYNRGTAPNLRGLGYGATLVLVNGRRQAQAGSAADFVDLSNIPWSSVERIEVLPDGTSALYGSDAIAGVVNIVLREELDGSETQTRYASALGGSDEKVFSQLLGGNWGSGKWLASYQFSERGALAAASRDYAADADKTAFGGRDFRSFYGAPGNILSPASLEPISAIPSGQDGSPLTSADLLPGVVNLRNPFADYELTPARRMHSLALNGSQKVGEHLEVYAEARLNERRAEQQQFQLNQRLYVPRWNPYFVDAYRDTPYKDLNYVVVAYNFEKEFGAAELHGKTLSYEGVLGLRYELGRDWQMNLASSFGREDLRWTESNIPDAAALDDAVLSSDPSTAFNPFGDGSRNNAAVLEAIRASYKSKVMSDIKVANFVADGTFFDIATGPVKVAVGAEARKEDLHQHLSFRDATSFGRQVTSVFTELSVPLVGQSNEPRSVPRLELSLAGRYEKYSDFGDTFNPKIGLRWVPVDWAKLRTSWGTSFRAPKLVDIYDTSENAAALITLPDPQGANGFSTVLVRQGNNRNLKQETARTWTLGLDLAPTRVPGLTASLTYYDIDYEGRIVTPGPPTVFDILFQESQWADAIIRKPTPDQIADVCNSPEYVKLSEDENCLLSSPAAIVDFRLRNMAITKTSGVDFKLDYALDTEVGAFYFGLIGNRALKFDQAFSPTAKTNDVVNTVGSPLALRVRTSIGWEQHSEGVNGFTAGATLDHSGGYRDAVLSTSRTVESFTTLDLRVGYRFAQNDGWLSNAEIAVNAVNVLNRHPPFVDRDIGYDVMNADPTGRVVAVFLSKSW